MKKTKKKKGLVDRIGNMDPFKLYFYMIATITVVAYSALIYMYISGKFA